MSDDDALRGLLAGARRIAVVGISDRADRPSYRVAEYLVAAGYEVVPVNPRVTEVLGIPAHASLDDVPGVIDVVDVFRRSEETDAPIADAIRLGAGAIWLQLGVENDAGAAQARSAGVAFVQGRCIAIEHARLIGRP